MKNAWMQKLAVLIGLTTIGSGAAIAQTTSTQTVYDIPVQPMAKDGNSSVTLAKYKGKVLLIVNVASKCGFTKQYAGLEELNKKYSDKGLVILGFPSNDFKGQEPGTEEEIVQFCTAKFNVTFPLYAKVQVTGADKAPLYEYLTEGDHPGKGEVGWNFNKFLVDRNGHVVEHYQSKVTPDAPELTGKIEELLAAGK